MPQPRPADIRALVQRLRGGSAAQQTQAALRLALMYESAGDSKDAVAAAIATAGGIPALLQLIDTHVGEGLGAESACTLLAHLTHASPARCQAIIAAGGVSPLTRCLESSSIPDVQTNAASTLANIAHAYGGGEAGAAAIVASAAIPAAIRRLGSSDEWVSERAAMVLCNIASCHERRSAVLAAGGIPPLVRLLRRLSPGVWSTAALALGNLTLFDGSEPRVVAIEEAGGIPPLVELLATSSDAAAVAAAAMTVRNMLLRGRATVAAKVIEAGGIPALVRCLQGQQFHSKTHERSAVCLGKLASGGAQPSGAIAQAGGIRALVQALERPCSPEVKDQASFALSILVCQDHAAAVAAADPANAVAATLERLPRSPEFCDRPPARACIAQALRLLAAARRSMPVASAAAAPAGQAAPSTAAAARVCAAPGCGATAGLKRCAGCGSVRYCNEACMRAHWKEHRPECKRLRAAAAAAAGIGAAGPPSSGQA